MRRVLALFLISILALALAPVGAGAAVGRVEVGKVRLGVGPQGGDEMLVPVSLPIEVAGRPTKLTLAVLPASGRGRYRAWNLNLRPDAGPLRRPERRERFTFVYRQPVGARIAALVRDGARVEVRARGIVDVDYDGVPESRSTDASTQAVGGGEQRLCASAPRLRASPGRKVAVRLPACSGARRPTWRIAARPKQGRVKIERGSLVYAAAPGFRGTASIVLRESGGASSTVQITTGSGRDAVVRALGDSVTAGFGYFEEGSPMPFEDLLSCRPGESSYDDACSSNSKVRSNAAAKVEYATDYGLANNVSWVAQWANEHGVTDFKNFAVSGSEPADWFGKGQFAETTEQLLAEDPDSVLLTLGANPLLSDMLFGVGNIGCGVWADVFGRFRECLAEDFAEIGLRANLKTLYARLVEGSDAEIFVMQYHLSIPTAALYGVDQIAMMGKLLNREIAAVAGEVSPSRITVVSPPHFDVGLSLVPVYPNGYKCEGRFFSSQVDGRSVQSTASQDLLEGLHPLEFCAAREGEAPWVISGDTGIHPSATGYAQMAARVPPPE